MLSALITFASAEGGEETSKTLFYVLGGLAAAYGVVIAAVGITQPEFPRTQGTARAVFALSAVVVGLAVAGALLTN